MARNRSYEMDLCSGAILPKLLLFALPMMFSSILQLLFNAADVIVVGRFAGDISLAAVGSTTAIVNLMVTMFIGLSVGANVTAARSYGANDYESLRQTVHTSILLSLISGVVLLLLGVFSAEPILIWMQSPERVRGLATLYLRIYFLGMPALLVYNFGAALLRAVGDTRRPLAFLLSSGVVNVVLNLIFVIVFHLDVAGVALATIASEYLSAFLVVRCLMREQGGVHLNLRHLRLYKPALKQILQVGLPAGLQNMLFDFSNVVIQSTINSFGEIVVAGNSAASNLDSFIYASMNSFSQANVSFISQNMGAERYDRIRPILLRTLGCVTVLGSMLGGLVIFFGPPLLGIYSDNPAVISAGMIRLWIMCLPYAMCGLQDVMAGSLRGMGYAITPTIVSLMGACVLRLILIATILPLPQFHSIETVYFLYPITWTLTFIAQTICFMVAMRRLKNRTMIST